ncbi:MAG: RNA polymerase sigma factor RpoE [Woeseiaceae bacterium]
MGERSIDQALVERVQKGDKKAFDILVLKYQQRVMNILSRFVRDHYEVQDLAQETFIKAYRALATFRGDSAFYTWVYRIAINTAKNFLVAQGRRPPRDDIESSEAEQYDGASNLHDHATPERILLKDEIAETVLNAINDLPEDLRMAITLREIEGLSYDEIAETMSCPIGTVRSRIFRARETVDEKLKPLLND